MDHSIYQDAAEKRDADLALVAQKSQDKADLETDLNDDKTDKQAPGAGRGQRQISGISFFDGKSPCY